MSISIMFHPSLLARRVLTAICVPIGTILCLVPVPKFSHAPLRIACAALGSFGVVVSTAILARIPSWGDPWRHYWSPSAVEWESSKEKALSAMYCVLLVIGVLCDWLLHRKVGGNPDQVSVFLSFTKNLVLMSRIGTSIWYTIARTCQSHTTDKEPSLHCHHFGTNSKVFVFERRINLCTLLMITLTLHTLHHSPHRSTYPTSLQVSRYTQILTCQLNWWIAISKNPAFFMEDLSLQPNFTH